jgi:Glycosyltransferase
MGMRYALTGFFGRRLPVVCHQRDNYSPDYFHLGLSRADCIIAISQHVKSQLPIKLQARTEIIYNAVSATKLPTTSPLRQPGKMRVVAAGRATPDKGFDILLTAASHLAGQHDFDLHLWGLDPAATSGYAGEIATAAKSLRALGVRVMQEPFRGDIESLYSMADIVVVPSRFPEPFGRMAIEAMAWHKPLLVAGHGGLVEIVKDGWNGLTHKPADPADLGRQLGRLLGDKRLREALAANAAWDVQTRFTAKTHADKVLQIYERLHTARW